MPLGIVTVAADASCRAGLRFTLGPRDAPRFSLRAMKTVVLDAEFPWPLSRHAPLRDWTPLGVNQFVAAITGIAVEHVRARFDRRRVEAT